MPFTISHIAAALPLKDMKTKSGYHLFDLTGLIVGSMAPDFEFFLQMKPMKPTMDIPIGHTISGMFYYDLPLCFLLAWIFHRIIKASLLLHLPQPLDQQYKKYAFQKWLLNSWKSFFVFCYSALIAMGIHILWDAFTHNNSPVVQHVEWLSSLINIFSYNIPLYKLLDHSGSIFGLMIVLYYLYIFGRNELPHTSVAVASHQKIGYFAMIVCIGVAVQLLWIHQYGISGGMGKEDIAGLVISLMSGLFIGTIVVSHLVYKIYLMEKNDAA